jgi:hypothetical protein
MTEPPSATRSSASNDVGHLHHPALEEVADALPAFEQVDRRLDLDMRRQQQDPDLRRLRADRAGRFKTFPALRRRHADIDNDEVRARLSHEARECIRLAYRADDVVPFTVEQARDPFAQEDVVLGDDDPRSGHNASLRVPWRRW